MILCETVETSAVLNAIRRLPAEKIMARYFANLLAAAILLRAGDKGIRLTLRDDHSVARKLRDKASYVTALGGWVWYAEQNGGLSARATAALEKRSGYVLTRTKQGLHDMIAGIKKLDWYHVSDWLRVVSRKLDVRTDRTDEIRAAVENWPNLSVNDRAEVLSKCYYYLIETDRESPLIHCVKRYMSATLSGGGASKLMEDEGAPAGSVGGTDAAGMTTSSDISPFEYRLFGNKIIHRRKKRFKPVKFKAPSDKYRMKKTKGKVKHDEAN